MPVTYLVQGMGYVVLGQGEAADLWIALAALGAFTIASLVVASLVVPRAQ
ncbi:MAG: ABC-type multidrug transport system permease subunit [Halobacteriales archaeon]|jgi:ABC-type multidrug transport system permease subunit